MQYLLSALNDDPAFTLLHRNDDEPLDAILYEVRAGLGHAVDVNSRV